MSRGIYIRTKPTWNRGLKKDDPRVAKYVRRQIPPLMRFFDKVEIIDTCWIWTAYCDSEGYGHFWLNGTMTYAHYFLYELLVGPVPEGKEFDHLCRHTSCVNPAHLEPVTHQENCRRGEAGKLQRRRTHCPHGHSYEVNGYLDIRGKRQCRVCSRERDRQRPWDRHLRPRKSR